MRADCPICTQRVDRVAFRRDEYTYKKCGGCGALFVANHMGGEEIHRHYDEGYFEAHISRSKTRKGYDSYLAASKSMRETFQRRLRLIEDRVKSGTLLDVGTAYGTFLELAANQYDCTAVEISMFAARQARRVSHPAIALARLEHAPFSEKQFDIITMWDVIEHLIDPVTALQEVARLLKPSGFCFVSTDDAGSWLVCLLGQYWWSIAPPLHLCHLSQKSIEIAAQRTRQLSLLQTVRDERTYELNQIINHLGVSYLSRPLSRLGTFMKKYPAGRLSVRVRRPEQFIFILRKAA